MTTSKPGVTRYLAPELLDPHQFGFKHSNPSKESDIYSFAMTAYEVPYILLQYLAARVTNERLISMTRSSRETYRMVYGQKVSPPFTLYPVTGRSAQ